MSLLTIVHPTPEDNHEANRADPSVRRRRLTPLLSFRNGSQWKIQGNWSNAAFDGGTGYASRDGLKGCLDGGNFK
jgi:hypothetical protein